MNLILFIVGILVFALAFWISRQLQSGSPKRSTSGRSSQSSVNQNSFQPLSPQQRLEMEALVRQGKKIEAIKQVRQFTGLGLKEARDFIEDLEQNPNAALSPQPSRAISPEVAQEVEALIANNQLITAVKVIRSHTGWGLKEAKEYLDRIQSQSNDK
ncbi:MAG TPA: ribosomal protein L7/L12 [Stenomitos sp.]